MNILIVWLLSMILYIIWRYNERQIVCAFDFYSYKILFSKLDLDDDNSERKNSEMGNQVLAARTGWEPCRPADSPLTSLLWQKQNCQFKISVGPSGSRRSQLTRLESGSLRAADSSQLGTVRLATHRKPRPVNIQPAHQTPLLGKNIPLSEHKEPRKSSSYFCHMQWRPAGGTSH